ncbi:MAG: class I SAM-dependent methyltransferase [Pseudomonadota bacterium]
MSLRQSISRCIPGSIKTIIRTKKAHNDLNKLDQIECRQSNLISSTSFNLRNIFISKETDKEWKSSKIKLNNINLPDGTGGINPGDRRAVFYLIRHFKPLRVLEIGTHIGASTINIASALSDIENAKLTTVDLLDVNDPKAKPWKKYHAKLSPDEMIKELKFSNLVNFVTSPSHDYLLNCTQKFDFIFLDGGHEADTVYREIPAALNLLNNSGVVLLHDYYENLMPLWKNGSVIPGPYLAIERLKSEGASLKVIPLGELPWPTKLGSKFTSLGLLTSFD